jgi:molybdopterin-guanine dinucleotide biosynthesis protein A
MSPDLVPSVVGIVLAGGRSRRFGRDKLAEEVGGLPLVHHTILRMLEVCERVVVVIGPEADEPSMPAGVHVTIARDTAADQGPLRGLAAGLAVTDAPSAIVAGGDMPDLQPAVLGEMLRASRETGAIAVALSDRGETRPLPIALDVGRVKAVVDELLQGGTRSLRELLGAVETVVVDEPTWTALDPERRTLIDVDEPADLDRETPDR